MNRMANARQRYRQQGILTAGPVELVVMLYDGCLRQLRLAAVALEERRFQQANEGLQKAQDILMGLVMNLDLTIPMAEDLMHLYDFMLRELVAANGAKDARRLEPVMEMLETLRGAWAEIRRQQPAAGMLEE